MQVTIFSFFMAIVWSSIIVLIVYYLIKKRQFISMFGVSSMLVLYAFSIVRIVAPVEFFFTQEIYSGFLWNRLYEYLCIEQVRVMKDVHTRVYFLLWIWLLGAAILTSLFAIKYVRIINRLRGFEMMRKSRVEQVLEKVQRKIGKKINVCVYVIPSIDSPMGVGVTKKMILLPNKEYSNEQLYYILLHEMTHFLNKDIQLKVLVQLFCCIFWWNPIVYLLRADIGQTLEIKCDLTVVKEMDRSKKVRYLSTIVQVIQKQSGEQRVGDFETVSIVGNSQEKELIERFEIVSEDKGDKGKLSMNIKWYAGLISIVIMSYLFVVQTQYDPPEEDIVTEEGAFEITRENAYILKRKDGVYVLIVENAKEKIIKEEVIKIMLEGGFPLVEEE